MKNNRHTARRSPLRNRRGTSFVEILIALLLTSFIIVATLLYFTTATTSTELSRDMTVATAHAEYLLEEIRSRSTLVSITAEDWPARISEYAITTLPSETISVSFANPAANPLPITVSVNWTRKARTHAVTFTTELTK